MQFNSKITVFFNRLNDYAELEAVSSKALKCAVLEYGKGRWEEEEGSYTGSKLQVLIPNKPFSPYKDIQVNNHLTLEYEGEVLSVDRIMPIVGRNGKTKYSRVDLTKRCDENRM